MACIILYSHMSNKSPSTVYPVHFSVVGCCLIILLLVFALQQQVISFLWSPKYKLYLWQHDITAQVIFFVLCNIRNTKHLEFKKIKMKIHNIQHKQEGLIRSFFIYLFIHASVLSSIGSFILERPFKIEKNVGKIYRLLVRSLPYGRFHFWAGSKILKCGVSL